MTLREFTRNDIAIFSQWLGQSHVRRWYQDPEDWLIEVKNENGEYDWIHHFIVEINNTPIGFCQYYDYSESGEIWNGDIEIEGTYSIDYLLGEPAYLKKGYGKAMVLALVSRIKKETDAKRIIVQPEPENLPSCHTLLASGFTYDSSNQIYLLDLT